MCLNNGCEGVLFTTCHLASGSRWRISNMTYPFALPVAWIRHMISLPGMAELMQGWRNNEDDNEELSTPVSSDEWMHSLDPNRPIGDRCEGWGWCSTMAGLERHQDPDTGYVTDQSMLDLPVCFVSLLLGLSFSLNTDW
jgi:hypothetical protein